MGTSGPVDSGHQGAGGAADTASGTVPAGHAAGAGTGELTPPQVDQRGISGSSAFHFYFGDGFDLYTLASDCATQWNAPATAGTNLLTLGGGRFSDSQGVYLNSGAILAANLGQSTGNQYLAHHISVAVMQPTAIGGTTQGLRISFYQGGALQNSIGFRSDGTISMLNSAGRRLLLLPVALRRRIRGYSLNLRWCWARRPVNLPFVKTAIRSTTFIRPA